MSEKSRPEPTEPADPGTDDASKLQPGESFLAPDDDADETGGSGGGERPRPSVPPPPD